MQSDFDFALQRIENCADDIRTWMNQNFLKLNDSKTEFMILGSKQQITKVNIQHVRVGESYIEPATNVRNLGVMFDSNLTMDCHVTAVSKSAFCSIRNIGRMRKHLTRDAAETIIHAFVTSRIDSSNSLLYGITNTQLSRLQRLQNIAARIITYTKKTDHITPVLADLHWLPIEQRLKYKICLIIYKIMHDKAPSYLAELVQPYVPGHRGLRSSRQGLLQEKFSKHQWGQRSFQVAAPKLWNNLPGSVKLSNSLHTFKKNLKTYLYLEAFA